MPKANKKKDEEVEPLSPSSAEGERNRVEVNNQGRLSFEEKEYIKVNAHKMLDSQMAEHLGRRFETIRDFRVRDRIAGRSDGDDKTPASNLRGSIHWPFIIRQFTEEEVKLIENLYKAVCKQFSSDVLATEEMTVLDLLKTEVLINRSLEQMADSVKMKARMLKTIEKIEKDSTKSDAKRGEEIGELNKQIIAIENASSARTKEYDTLQGKKAKAQQDLKGTREQRLKLHEQSKANFFDWLKLIDEEEEREKQGEMLAIYQRAVEREKRKLAKPHKYADENCDLPLLNAETIENYHLVEQEELARLKGEAEGEVPQ